MNGDLYAYIISISIGLFVAFFSIFYWEWNIAVAFGAGTFAFCVSYFSTIILVFLINPSFAKKIFKDKRKIQKPYTKPSSGIGLQPVKIITPENLHRNQFVLNGLCACDRCGRDLIRGEGCLNNRNSMLYCEDCWNHMKSLDSNGEELFLNESFSDGVIRTNHLWQ